MNTKILLIASSGVLGLAGLLATFAPQELLNAVGVPPTGLAQVLVQLLGALYFAFALMNWTAKDSAIGGIYARPISFGNFAHFLVGAIALFKALFAVGANGLILGGLSVYVVFAGLFWWLVFRHDGRIKS